MLDDSDKLIFIFDRTMIVIHELLKSVQSRKMEFHPISYGNFVETIDLSTRIHSRSEISTRKS